MRTNTHAALLRAFVGGHGLTKVRTAELLGLSDPKTAGRVTITRWLGGKPCSIPLQTLRCALAEIERQLATGDAHMPLDRPRRLS
jgi:hypothetical protein